MIEVDDLVKVDYSSEDRRLTLEELDASGRYARVLARIDEETMKVLPLNGEPISIAVSNVSSPPTSGGGELTS